MSVLGLAPMVVAAIVLLAVTFENVSAFTSIVILDWLITFGIFIICYLISVGINKLAGIYSKRYINRMVRKNWEFADRYSLDNPGMLEKCKELNPEFAQKLVERIEREIWQDILLEREAQEALRQREARRQARDYSG